MAEAAAVTFACSDNDRTRAIVDGRVRIEGCDVTCLVLEPAEMFGRACRYFEFDITELSFSSYMRMVDNGQFAVRRACPPSCRVRSAIRPSTSGPTAAFARPRISPARSVGVPEYQMTAALWLRGMLQDEHGVKPTDIKWRTGGQEQPGREERMPVSIPGLDLKPIPEGADVVGNAASGEIDAMLSARTPSVYLRRAPNVDRLFPELQGGRAGVLQEDRLFSDHAHRGDPARRWREQYPWLPASIYKALLESKAIGLEKLTNLAQLCVALPWMEVEATETKALMGNDYWRYGVKECRHEIDVMTRYAHEQGLTARKLAAEELFAPSTFKMAKI